MSRQRASLQRCMHGEVPHTHSRRLGVGRAEYHMAAAPPGSEVQREGWLRKRPTPQTGRPWKESTVNKRFFVTRGFHVTYYNTAKPKAGIKPNGSFDLRRVVLIRPLRDRDPTAREFVLELDVGVHKIALDFGYFGEMREWMRFWVPAIPDHAIPVDWEFGQETKKNAAYRSAVKK